jgi:hypothetical protein
MLVVLGSGQGLCMLQAMRKHCLEGAGRNQSRKNTGGIYSGLPIKYAIRNTFHNLYETSLEADVAVAFIPYPPEVEFAPFPVSFFVTDDRLKELEVPPGDDFFVLGFPLFTELKTFPVLRRAILSSYPVTPMKTAMRYYLNFKVFPGDSGGPIYFDYANRDDPSRGQTVGRESGILGLETGLLSSSASGIAERLDIAEVVPAIYITEAITRLGSHPQPRNILFPIRPASNGHSQ